MLKLKLQYFGHLTQRAVSLEKSLRLGKIKGQRRRRRQRMRRLDSIIDSVDMNLSKLRVTVEDRGAWQISVILFPHLNGCIYGNPIITIFMLGYKRVSV